VRLWRHLELEIMHEFLARAQADRTTIAGVSSRGSWRRWQAGLIAMAACGGPLLYAQQAAPKPTGPPAAVSGTVIDAQTSRPIPGAMVELWGRYRDGRQSVTTDARGQFVFADLPEGIFAITARKLGYFAATFGDENPRSTLNTGFLAELGQLRLKAGEWHEGATIRLWRFGSISGRVLDEYGEPVVGRFVRVLAAPDSKLLPPLSVADVALTDDRGEYSVGRLMDGDYVVAVLPNSGDGLLEQVSARQVYPLRFYPNASTSADAGRVTLRPGQDLEGIDISLQPSPARRVLGRVNGPQDELTAMRLGLRPVAETEGVASTVAARAYIQNDGTFEFPSVPSGDYVLTSGPWLMLEELPSAGLILGAPRLFELPGNRLNERPVSRSNYWVRELVHVTADADVRVVADAHPPITLSGRVVRDQPDATVPDSIGLHSEEGYGYSGGKVADDGSFSIEVSLAGPLFLTVSRGWLPGPRPSTDGLSTLEAAIARYPNGGHAFISGVTQGGSDYTGRPLDFTNMSSMADVVVHLTLGGRLAGTASRTDGTVATGQVFCLPADRTRWSDENLTVAAPIRSDGSFETGEMAIGKYIVVAVANPPRNPLADRAFLDAAALVGKLTDVRVGQTSGVTQRLENVQWRH